GPPPTSAMVSLLPSWSTRVMRLPRISQTASEPSGSTTGPSGNSRPSVRTRTSATSHLSLLVPDPGLNRTGGRTAAVHQRGIEGHLALAVLRQRDQTALAVERLDHPVGGFGHGRARVADPRGNLMRRGRTDEALALTRARDRDHVVGPGARSDHGRVAHAAR